MRIEDGVIDWRMRRLELAGVPTSLAQYLARTDQIDLHEMLDLLDRGCPPHLAVRILAPIDK
jgi:hypothetical protein